MTSRRTHAASTAQAQDSEGLHERFEALEATITTLREELSSERDRSKRIEAEKHHLENQKGDNELVKENRKLDAHVQHLEGERDRLNAEVGKLEHLIKTEHEKQVRHGKQRRQLKERIEELSSEVGASKAQASTVHQLIAEKDEAIQDMREVGTYIARPWQSLTTGLCL